MKGKSRWVKVADLPDDDDKEWLSKGWDDDGEHVQSYVESVGNGWTANQVSCGVFFGGVFFGGVRSTELE